MGAGRSRGPPRAPAKSGCLTQSEKRAGTTWDLGLVPGAERDESMAEETTPRGGCRLNLVPHHRDAPVPRSSYMAECPRLSTDTASEALTQAKSKSHLFPGEPSDPERKRCLCPNTAL